MTKLPSDTGYDIETAFAFMPITALPEYSDKRWEAWVLLGHLKGVTFELTGNFRRTL